jgi:hypothetical protein
MNIIENLSKTKPYWIFSDLYSEEFFELYYTSIHSSVSTVNKRDIVAIRTEPWLCSLPIGLCITSRDCCVVGCRHAPCKGFFRPPAEQIDESLQWFRLWIHCESKQPRDCEIVVFVDNERIHSIQSFCGVQQLSAIFHEPPRAGNTQYLPFSATIQWFCPETFGASLSRTALH